MTAPAADQVWAHRRSTRRVQVRAVNATHAFVVPAPRHPGSMAGAGRHSSIPIPKLAADYKLEQQ